MNNFTHRDTHTRAIEGTNTNLCRYCMRACQFLQRVVRCYNLYKWHSESLHWYRLHTFSNSPAVPVTLQKDNNDFFFFFWGLGKCHGRMEKSMWLWLGIFKGQRTNTEHLTQQSSLLCLLLCERKSLYTGLNITGVNLKILLHNIACL